MSELAIQELKNAIKRLENEKIDLQLEIDSHDVAIEAIEKAIEKLLPNPTKKKFESVTEAVRHVFQSNIDVVFTSITISDLLREMIDKGQLKLRKDQNLKHLVRSALYTLTNKGYIQKFPSSNPLIDNEYKKPFVLVS